MIEADKWQRQLKGCKRIVVKIGSSYSQQTGKPLNVDAISHWANPVADLRNAGHEDYSGVLRCCG